MKILFFVNSFLPTIGGREIVTYYLAKALIKLGHKVRIFGPLGFLKKRRIPEGIPIHRWPCFNFLSIEKIWYLNLYLDTAIWGCDVIHAHATNPSGYIAARMKNKIGCPLIITPHGADIQVIPEINYGQRLDPVKNMRIAAALASADKLTAISEGIASAILSTGTRSKKIALIPNGVEIERFNSPGLKPAFDFLKLDRDSKIIVNVGNYRLCKGQEVLIRAMPEILKVEPKARLVIVGNGTQVLKPLIQSLHLEKYIHLTGRIDLPFLCQSTTNKADYSEGTDLLASIYSDSYVYVSAGIDEGAEGFPLTTLEAMAAGLPIVATNISGNRDVVRDSINGYLVEPNKSAAITKGVLSVLQDERQRLQMGTAARESSMKYSWESVAAQYVEVYKQAIHSNSMHQ